MPVLKNQRETITIKPEKYPDAEIKMYTSFTVGDAVENSADEEDITQGENLLRMLTRVIQEWNFTDEEENPLPITEENIKMLDVSVLNDIVDVVDLGNSKKNTQNT